MRAVLTSGFGGPDVLRVGTAPKPAPAEGQVLVKVAATSVNRPDLVQREGKYPPPPGDSDILGLEVAGTVERVGEGVEGWKAGDRVVSLVGGGGYAEFAAAHAGHLMRIPDNVGFEEGACICESYITAFLNVFMLGGLKDGEPALIHGGGGGVANAAIQLCRALAPSSKLAVTAHPSKAERVKELGADLVIDYTTTKDFSEAVKEFTGKKGVAVVLDHLGGRYLAPNMASLAVGGRLVVIGITGGPKAELNLALMMVKRQQIIGSVLRSRSVAEKAAIAAEFQRRAMPKFADGTIRPIIERVFPLEDVKQAHLMMEEDRHFGKIVLKVS
ncbi:NAD(P)H quinone oxidoreductase, PIG3 family [Hyaloraphidium curvatum]|nr:NAD(P)H quinone oxidoreductase, PIG3 family [Hyaloraphidium curvatum]